MLEKLHLALAIQNTPRVKLGYTLDRSAIAARIKVDNLLVGMLKREENGVSRESSEGRVKLLQKR
jgi:hypothetical protein